MEVKTLAAVPEDWGSVPSITDTDGNRNIHNK